MLMIFNLCMYNYTTECQIMLHACKHLNTGVFGEIGRPDMYAIVRSIAENDITHRQNIGK